MSGAQIIDGGIGGRGIYAPRLLLRWLAPEDADALTQFAGDPEIRRRTETIPHPYDFVAAQSWIEEGRGLRLADAAYRFAIIERRRNEFIGVSALTRSSEGAAELGYWLGRPFWDRGYGREAVTATLAYGQDILGLTSVTAEVYSENTASVAVLRGHGFQQLGFETSHVPERGGQRLIARFERRLGADAPSLGADRFSVA